MVEKERLKEIEDGALEDLEEEEEVEATLQWIRGAKRMVHPRRGSPMNPKNPKPLTGTMTREEFRKELHSARLNFCNWLLETGILTDTMEEEHRALAREMQEDWREVSDAPLRVDHEAMACYWWVKHWHRPDAHDALIRLWLACEGPAFALEALVRAQELMRALYPEQDSPMETEADIAAGFGLIRRALAFASQESYDAAVEKAKALWPTLEGLYWQAAVAYLFPDEAAWGEETIEGYLAVDENKRKGLPFLVASGASIESWKKLVASNPKPGPAEAGYVASALEFHGAGIWEQVLLMADCIPRWVDKPERLLKVLAVIKHPEVAEHFAWQMDRRKVPLKVDRDYLERHQELFLPVLEDMAEWATEEEHPLALALWEELRST